MATVRKAPSVYLSTEQLLERGWPGELLPADQERLRAAAHWYLADANHPEDARARVHAVWIEDRYLPAWDARGARQAAPTEETA